MTTLCAEPGTTERSVEPTFDDWMIEGHGLVIRPIEPTDVDRLERMFQRLSRRTVYLRFHLGLRWLSPATLAWMTNVDHCHREALVALDDDEIVAVARYHEIRGLDGPDARDAEIAVTVQDGWQHQGLGTRLTRALVGLAVDRGFDAIVAAILPGNRTALELARRLAPDASVTFDGEVQQVRLPLRQPTIDDGVEFLLD
jgi:acetyltransferase